MLGFDFYCFWLAGQAVLAGQNPYYTELSKYPPAATYLFALLALFPFSISFGIWTGLNLILFYRIIYRIQKGLQKFAWLAFAPTIFVLLTGQIDILLLWLAGFLVSDGWKAILAAVLLTLKPQVALIVLPWFLLQWLLHQRKKLFVWAAGTIAIHALPLLADPTIYQKWFAITSSISGWRFQMSPGIFAFTALNVPLAILIILAAALAVIGLFGKTMFSWTAQMLTLPAGLWYENVLLIGSAPWWLLVPISWGAFLVGAQVHSNIPFVVIPLTSFAWQWFVHKEKAIPHEALPGAVG